MNWVPSAAPVNGSQGTGYPVYPNYPYANNQPATNALPGSYLQGQPPYAAVQSTNRSPVVDLRFGGATHPKGPLELSPPRPSQTPTGNVRIQEGRVGTSVVHDFFVDGVAVAQVQYFFVNGGYFFGAHSWGVRQPANVRALLRCSEACRLKRGHSPTWGPLPAIARLIPAMRVSDECRHTFSVISWRLDYRKRDVNLYSLPKMH